jgi:uncharacterized protein YcgL (UPF0745 family)
MRNSNRSICIFFLILLAVGTAQAQDLEEGFLGLPWKTNLSTQEEFLKTGEKNEVSYYVNPKKVYVINNIKIPFVVYGAYIDKFFAVYMNIESIDVYSQMKRYITEKYGSPKMTMTLSLQNDIKIFIWKNKDTKIKLKLNETSGDMKLAFYYTPLSSRVNEALEEAYEMTSKGFKFDKERAVEALDLLKF